METQTKPHALHLEPLFVLNAYRSWPRSTKSRCDVSICQRSVVRCSESPRKRKPRKPKGFWDDIENIREELVSFQKGNSDAREGTIPTARELRAAGRRDLDNAIYKQGGYHKVSKALGMKRASKKRAPGYWNNFSNLESEIYEFLKEYGEELPKGSMPTQKQFRDRKRSDIVEGMEVHGGSALVAEKLGLVGRKSKKSTQHWKDWANVEAELKAFVEEQHIIASDDEALAKDLRKSLKKHPRMPSQKELRASGRSDLAEAISSSHGGFREAARRLGFAPRKKDDFFYDSFHNLARELYSFAIDSGEESVMPSTAVIHARGRTDLAAAIRKYKGMSEVSQRLGLQYRVRTREAFKDWDIFRRSLLSFIEQHGTTGEIPSSRTLSNFGRSDLYQAILHHGGPANVADGLGLKRGFWQDFHNVGRELLDFIAIHGNEGVMPTERDFLEIGRSSLNLAVSKFGYSLVAQRLGLSEPLQSTQVALDTLLDRSLDLWEYRNCEDDSDEDREDGAQLAN